MRIVKNYITWFAFPPFRPNKWKGVHDITGSLSTFLAPYSFPPRWPCWSRNSNGPTGSGSSDEVFLAFSLYLLLDKERWMKR